MDSELVNTYIEALNIEVMDLTKQKIILKSQLAFQEKLAGQLQAKIDELEKSLDKQSAKLKKKEDF